MSEKIIVNKDINFILRPARWVYRKMRYLFPKQQTLKQLSLNGMTYLVWINEDIGRKMMITRSFESSETNALKKLIKKGDTCFDIGGNIGYYSLNMSALASDKGRVYAFEPIKRNALVIELAAQLNNFKNIKIENVAVSNTEGSVILNIPEDDGAYAYLGNGSENEGLEVQTITLDDFVLRSQITQVNIIKVDVEGAEMMVLGGANNILSSSLPPRAIMMELVDEYLARFGSSVSEVLILMEKYGYKPYYAQSNGDLLEADKNRFEANFFFIHNKQIS